MIIITIWCAATQIHQLPFILSSFSSTSCPLMRWQWRCPRRSRLPLTCQLKHQPCCPNMHTHATICIPTFLPALLSDLLCVCLRPLKHVLVQALPSVFLWSILDVWEWESGSDWSLNKWMNVMFEKQQKLPDIPLPITHTYNLAFFTS